jgi:hypothetical protein
VGYHKLRQELTEMKKILVLIVIGVMLSLVGCAGAGAVKRTPIPTSIPATLPAPLGFIQLTSFGRGQCAINALDLIAAWVAAGTPESDPFDLQSLKNETCQASYPADVQPLFQEPNVWFSGAIACTSCHGDEVKTSSAQMSLTTYGGIMAGSRRTDPNAKGHDILKGSDGTFEKSLLYNMIFTRQMPMGRPQDSPQKGPVVYVGKKR